MKEIVVTAMVTEHIGRDEVMKADGVAHFQVVGNGRVRWSAEPFSDTNKGFFVEVGDERIFPAPITVYFVDHGSSNLLTLNNKRPGE